MSYTPTNKKAPHAAHDVILSLFGEKGVLHGLRKGCGLTDVVLFSKEDEIIRITESYVASVVNHWNSTHNKKQVTPYDFPSINDKSNQLLDPPETKKVNLPPDLNIAPVGNSSKSSGSSDDKHTRPSPDTMNSQKINQNPGSIPTNAPTPVAPNPKISFILKNAKVGEPYFAELQIQGETENKKVVINEVVFPEGLGLSALEHDFRKVSGSPLIDGEKKVFVRYQFQDAKPENPLLQSEFNLFINPDPKSLWLKKEPDSSLPYFKKHLDNNSIKTKDNYIMAAASRRGRSHEHGGTFRDDDFLLAAEHGWDILVVADGAGSAKSSRKGSEIAVNKSVQFLATALSTQSAKIEQEAATWFANQAGSQHGVKSALYETFGRAAFAAVKAIEEEALSMNAPIKDYSTTLLLAGHIKLPVGHFFAAYWVGDGGVGVYEKGKHLQLLGDVDSGEFAGQTRFLDKQVVTPEELMKRLRFTVTDEFTGLVLMTDGVTDPKFETDNNLANLQKWDELWGELEPLLANSDVSSDKLLEWLEFWSPGNHDDRTIALLYK